MINEDRNISIPPMPEMPKGTVAPPPVSAQLEADDTQQQILLKLDAIMQALGIKNINANSREESSNGR